jgi:hypothetical protein
MRLKLNSMSDFTRRGLTVFGLAIDATLALGATSAKAQGLRIGGAQVQIVAGNGGYIAAGYNAGYPRRVVPAPVFGGVHYGHYGPSLHYDRVYHPEYSHWTPRSGWHTHGHYDLVPHVTPGRHYYDRGPHRGHHHGRYHDPHRGGHRGRHHH